MRLDTNIDHLPESRWESLEFHGKGIEYFKIWIVNIFLSVITFGIYSAWAKVRTKRYFYGNTMLNGSVFEYHAKPLSILKGRVIAVILLAIVIGLGFVHPLASSAGSILIALIAPWVICRSIIFNARMTSYRNVHFGFVGKSWSLYYIFLVIPVLFVLCGAGSGWTIGFLGRAVDLFGLRGIDPVTAALIGGILALYLSFPYIHKHLTSYFLNHRLFGQGRFRARLHASFYYWTYLKWFILSTVILAVGWSLIFLASVVMGNDLSYFNKNDVQEAALGSLPPLIMLLLFIPFFIGFSWIKAYTTSLFRNYAFGRMQLQSAATFKSEMQHNRLFGIQFTNFLLLVFTLGIAWPWTRIRLARYRIETLSARIYGDLEGYITQMQDKQSALGEEMGEAFDINLDLGL